MQEQNLSSEIFLSELTRIEKEKSAENRKGRLPCLGILSCLAPEEKPDDGAAGRNAT
jgi:hypothetical protein